MAIYNDQDITAFNGRKFIVSPFNTELVTPLGYDLTIGFAVALPDKDLDVSSSPVCINSCSKQNSISIPPNHSAFIVTRERVWLGEKTIGTLHSKGSFAAAGIFINATTVDPNWKGQLGVLIKNMSLQHKTISSGEPFLTLLLHEAYSRTRNVPDGNPLQTASRYGELYGRNISEVYLEYIQNTDSLTSQREFEKQIEEAKRKTVLEVLGQTASRMGRLFFYGVIKHSRSSIGHLIALSILLILAFTTSSFFMWDEWKNLLGFTGEFSATTATTICLTCLVFLASYLRTK